MSSRRARRNRATPPPDGIVFLASLEGASCIKVDGDGACTVRFTVSARDMGQLTALAQGYREQLLTVTVRKYSSREGTT